MGANPTEILAVATGATQVYSKTVVDHDQFLDTSRMCQKSVPVAAQVALQDRRIHLKLEVVSCLRLVPPFHSLRTSPKK